MRLICEEIGVTNRGDIWVTHRLCIMNIASAAGIGLPLSQSFEP